MVVLIGGIDAKADDNVVKEAVFAVCLSLAVEVFSGMENKFVFAGSNLISFKHRRIATAVCVGDGA